MNFKQFSSNLIFAFIILGFTSMMSQLIVIRELIVVFTGNELTMGIILSLWLLWTATGSGFFGWLSSKLKNPVRFLYFFQLIFPIMLLLIVIFVRLSRLIFNIIPGEMANPFLIFIIPLIAFAPLGLSFGLLYPISCAILSKNSHHELTTPGRVYLLEAIGSGCAGFIASIFLFRCLENFQILLIISSLSSISGLLVLHASNKKLFRSLLPVLLFFYFIFLLSVAPLNRLVNKILWGSLNLVESKTTIYGDISVTHLDETVSFYENGALIFANPDLMSAEESVHFALLEHPQPQKILLIGGDAQGSISQILLHPSIKCIDFVLLDPALIALTRKYLPAFHRLEKNEKIRIHFQDGRSFLKTTSEKYDVIIINLPPPQTTMLNRFYTSEFYSWSQKKLADSGVMSFSISAAEDVISKEQAELLSCLYLTFKQVFKEVALIPGFTIHFIGSNSPGLLTEDPEILSKRIKQRNLPTKYINDYYLRFRMSPERLQYLHHAVKADASVLLNRDFHPISYFYSLYLWLANFNKKMIGSIENIFQLKIFYYYFLLLIFFLVGIYFYSGRQKIEKLTARAIYVSMILIGCTTISLEIIIIHSFQAIYGYAYFQLTLIMTGFMIGLACGSWISLRHLSSTQLGIARFAYFQLWLTSYPIVAYLFFLFLLQISLPSVLVQLIFLTLIIGLGFIGGYQFPLANSIIYRQRSKIDSVSGTIYAWDLFGAVIGALLTSTFVIPVFGLTSAIFSFAILNFVIFALLILVKKLN